MRSGETSEKPRLKFEKLADGPSQQINRVADLFSPKYSSPRSHIQKTDQARIVVIALPLGIIRALKEDLTQSRISEYEAGTGEPSLIVLLKYARLAGVAVDVLIDDKLDLPKLPAKGRKP